MTSIPILDNHSYEFPPISTALDEPNGLLAAGGDLSVDRLKEAYRHGIFPWFEDGQPILWWSPDPRCVVFCEHFKPSRSLKKTINKGIFEVRIDSSFREVIEACSMPRTYSEDTWITDDMITAYCRLHHQGYAHSFECWHEDKLVGGLYGVSLGSFFFGESMFSTMSNASKVAFVALVNRCKSLNIPVIDCQVTNDHLLSLGAEEIDRENFQELLESNLQDDVVIDLHRGKWSDKTGAY
ncbi:MAG: leucyl/phenylalanyl-tRNA--protein transferase [Pseudomonadales bacterium]|nr:leucyl/phenylalanyl-tRNA--protein transferase [Pseudomonadales bacterium]